MLLNHRNISQLLPLGALTTFAFFAGCGQHEAPASSGGADLTVKTLLSAADITTVTATVSGAGLPVPRSVALSSRSVGTWGGLIGKLPAGTGYLFNVNATDVNGVVQYTGAASGVTIVQNVVTSVVITAQQATAPTPFQNSLPVIDAFVLSSSNVAPGATITATVTAHDPDAGDTLSYAWTVSPTKSGVFSAPTAAATKWTAPTTAAVVLGVGRSRPATARRHVILTRIRCARVTAEHNSLWKFERGERAPQHQPQCSCGRGRSRRNPRLTDEFQSRRPGTGRLSPDLTTGCFHRGLRGNS